jgi:hypothetical protein
MEENSVQRRKARCRLAGREIEAFPFVLPAIGEYNWAVMRDLARCQAKENEGLNSDESRHFQTWKCLTSSTRSIWLPDGDWHYGSGMTRFETFVPALRL